MKITETIINLVLETITKSKKNHTGEIAYSECEIQEGYSDFLKINVRRDRIGIFTLPFDWGSPVIKGKLEEPLDTISKEELDELVIPKLKKRISELFFDESNQPTYKYSLNVYLEFDYKTGIHKEEFQLKDTKRLIELQNRTQNFIDKVIYKQERKIKDKRELSVFCGKLLDFNVTQFSYDELKKCINFCIEKTFKNNINKRFEKEFLNSILYNLKKWLEETFKPLHFNKKDNYSKFILKDNFNKYNVNSEELELWVYICYLRIKYKDYSSFAMEDLKIASNIFGSETAKKYLNFGTGTFATEDIHFKNKELECKANDVLAEINIKMNNDTEENYAIALNFIINLLQKGFPKSYKIKLSCKTPKQFLNIKGIAKSSTHRFFSNCLNYKNLHNKLVDYANLAMVEFEWYTDVEEGEKSCLPGSYVVFGLGLLSEKYFSLVHKYFKLLDDEHQMSHRFYIANLIDTYGITKKSIDLICAGILSAQFEMKYKNLTELMKDEKNLKLLLENLKNVNKYEIEEIFYAIWGRNYKKTMKMNSELKEKFLKLV